MKKNVNRVAAIVLVALALSSCRTIQTQPVDLPTTPIVAEVKDEATQIVAQTVEIEKTIDHIITISDGQTKTELVGLRDQVVVLKSDARRHVKKIAELESANSNAVGLYNTEREARVKAESLVASRTKQRNIAAITALALAIIIALGIIITVKNRGIHGITRFQAEV